MERPASSGCLFEGYDEGGGEATRLGPVRPVATPCEWIRKGILYLACNQGVRCTHLIREISRASSSVTTRRVWDALLPGGGACVLP